MVEGFHVLERREELVFNGAMASVEVRVEMFCCTRTYFNAVI